MCACIYKHICISSEKRIMVLGVATLRSDRVITRYCNRHLWRCGDLLAESTRSFSKQPTHPNSPCRSVDRKQMEQRAETEKPPEAEVELPRSPVSPAGAEAPAIRKPSHVRRARREMSAESTLCVAKEPATAAAAAPALEEAGDSNFKTALEALSSRPWKFQCLRPLCCPPRAPRPRPRPQHLRLRHLCRSSRPRQRRLAKAPEDSTNSHSGSIGRVDGVQGFSFSSSGRLLLISQCFSDLRVRSPDKPEGHIHPKLKPHQCKCVAHILHRVPCSKLVEVMAGLLSLEA